MIEIERKFLVAPGLWPPGENQIRISQGYLVNEKGLVVRVRQKNENHYLSLKAVIDEDSSYDFEYKIPADEAQIMFDKLCNGAVICKTRHEVHTAGLLWEIDEFHGDNSGLVVAEVELTSADQQINLPDWVTEEVTQDYRYKNSALINRPFNTW